MSSIPPSMNIASSISQAALQQSEVAKAPDRARSEQARFAQKMREELRKHLETVEDSYEPTDALLRIDENDRNGSSGQQGQDLPSKDDSEESQKPNLDIEA